MGFQKKNIRSRFEKIDFLSIHFFERIRMHSNIFERSKKLGLNERYCIL